MDRLACVLFRSKTAPQKRWGKRTIRFGAFNIHGGKGIDGRRDMDRVAECLRDLDFVALNEVHGWSALSGSDQAELLGRRLGMQWLFASANEQWFYREFGNGLSRGCR